MPATDDKARPPWHACLCACLCALVAACGTPAGEFRGDAARRGFMPVEVHSDGRRLVLFRREVATPGAPLHVYLDGDGAPWLSRRRVAADPTTRERLVLDLVERDPAPSVIVGRPCYYLEDNPCDPVMWTAQRYGETVVAAMAAAINREIEQAPGSSITLIGYSGGGALAMLLAPRLARADNVLTVAANLDVAAWARHHGHTPLLGSLDPATAPPLSPLVRQVHWFGADDDNVPAPLMRHVAERQPDAKVRIIPGFDHECCWADAWPQLLREALPQEY